MKLKGITLNGRIVDYYTTVYDAEMEFTFSPEVQIRPWWMQRLRITKGDKLAQLIALQRELMEKEGPHGDRYREALKIGNGIINKLYRRQAGRDRWLRVNRGFDPEFARKYSDGKDFLVDIGIGAVDRDVYEKVVSKLVALHSILPRIEVEVPTGYDTHGWAAAVAMALNQEGISIPEFVGGEFDGINADVLMVFYLPIDVDLKKLEPVREAVSRQCKTIIYDIDPESQIIPVVRIVHPNQPKKE